MRYRRCSFVWPLLGRASGNRVLSKGFEPLPVSNSSNEKGDRADARREEEKRDKKADTFFRLACFLLVRNMCLRSSLYLWLWLIQYQWRRKEEVPSVPTKRPIIIKMNLVE